ncbi:MAG: acetoacetate--CoA ligase [Alphaproteobacteria bacterium]|nr:MAG: acetoacetate--CoA ligase [Alphaproteobacteria bacterium]
MSIHSTKAVVMDEGMKWQPGKDAAQTALAKFMRQVETETKTTFEGFEDFWRWSVANKEKFWSQVWDFSKVLGVKGETVFKPGAKFQDGRFFPDAKINFAENLLRRRDNETAIVFKGENRLERTLSYKQLYEQVSQVRQSLQDLGVTKGDRVAGYLPNMPETIIAMLAATSLGAIWSSASPDFGVQGVLDRFGQIEPKVMFCCDGYYYNGKDIDCRDKVKEVMGKLPSLKAAVMVEYLKWDIAKTGAISFDKFRDQHKPADIYFPQFEFNHPLYIMFSSGTTGIPKCIVHGAGGTLLQHLKEHRLHCDIKKGDNVFYFTTCGWMMWNWLVTALASEAALLLYDGSPFYPSGYALFDYVGRHACSLFGTSAKYIDALRVNDIHVADRIEMSSVRMMTSTGSPLSPEGFDYVYDELFPSAQLASISGGTDIVSCFVLGNPLSPVWRGEIQGPGLGMDVDVFSEDGKPMASGKGELVCKTPFPCMPVGFWNDADGAKYAKAYFERFPGIWCHGDWCEWTEHRGLIIHGRSDATLNPGGVRIGTAEIYRIVEQHPEVKESIAVGQDWDNDVRVILFVVLKEGAVLDEGLVTRLKKSIREQASPRHVPAKIVAVIDIPRTKSGKITELAVRDVIHGRDVKNVEALANPEALKFYRDLGELKS